MQKKDRKSNMDVFSDYADYYNLIYGDKDYQSEAKVIQKIIEKYQCHPVKKILNIGCGTGKHDFQLSQLGYRMKGIDLSPQMIKIANENYSALNEMDFKVGDARTYRTNEVYDAVIALFHVMSYQNRNEDIMKVFENVYQMLDENGLFVFDAWYGPGVLTDKPTFRVKRVEDDKNSVIRYASPIMYSDKNIVKVCYDILVINKETGTVREINEEHKMRYFFIPEMEFYLQASGFELMTCLDCKTLDGTSYETWTSYFIARRK